MTSEQNVYTKEKTPTSIHLLAIMYQTKHGSRAQSIYHAPGEMSMGGWQKQAGGGLLRVVEVKQVDIQLLIHGIV